MQIRRPRILADRDPVAALDKHASAVLSVMRKWDLGRIDDRETVHFCGLINHPDTGAVVFLPRSATTGDTETDYRTAVLTMKALARFGAEVSKREFEGGGENGNPGTLSVIKRLADDFRDHGLMEARKRIRGRNSGKPDWKRTIYHETATRNLRGQPIYAEIRTVRSSRSTEMLLAQIQAEVMREIIAMHGWWLLGVASRRNELVGTSRPEFPRAIWARKLVALLPSLYSARAIFLARYLGYYLDQTRASSDGSWVFGISDFHSVWEAILRDTLERSPVDGRSNWNVILPKPVYVEKAGQRSDAGSRGMRTDIILENPDEYVIVDAKYYAAVSVETTPGWPDIAKQLFYELAVEEAVRSNGLVKRSIRNVFVFPGDPAKGNFSRVEFRNSDGTSGSGAFGRSISCLYVPVSEALRLYVGGYRGIAI